MRRLAGRCRAARHSHPVRPWRQPASPRFPARPARCLRAARHLPASLRMSLIVLEPGIDSRIVDAGRPRTRSLGVPVGGAADRRSLALGNALVGNPPDAPALEITLSGPTLVADADTGMCVFGAPFRLDRDTDSVPAGHTFTLQAGQTLHIGGTP